MSLRSPTIEGLRAIFRQPSLTFAEISWRWALGTTVAVLACFYCVEYLDTLPVTNADVTLLSTRQPAFVGRAIAHIFRGSLNRAVLAGLLAVLLLSLLWIIAASVGRLATVRALLDYFRSDVTYVSANISGREKPRSIQALFTLNFLRVVLFLAVLLALGSAAILVSFVSTSANPRPGLSMILFLPIGAFICLVGWILNWWLTLAGIFAVRDGEDGLASISAAVTFSQDHFGAVCAVSTWTGLAHLVAFSIATSLVAFPLALDAVNASTACYCRNHAGDAGLFRRLRTGFTWRASRATTCIAGDARCITGKLIASSGGAFGKHRSGSQPQSTAANLSSVTLQIWPRRRSLHFSDFRTVLYTNRSDLRNSSVETQSILSQPVLSQSVFNQSIVILDFGAQYTQLIARRIREQNVFSVVLPCTAPLEEVESYSPLGIVLSGAPWSVYDKSAPPADARLFELGVPVLGICYGLQFMVHKLGGKVRPAEKREYGHAEIDIVAESPLF